MDKKKQNKQNTAAPASSIHNRHYAKSIRSSLSRFCVGFFPPIYRLRLAYSATTFGVFFMLCKCCSHSAACPPVLTTLWMIFATLPLRRELRSLTRSSRQVQRTASDPARRIRPTARSDSSVDANKCLPEGRREQQS